jgi:hypothetical protein
MYSIEKRVIGVGGDEVFDRVPDALGRRQARRCDVFSDGRSIQRLLSC